MQTKCKKLRDKIINNFISELKESNFYQLDFKTSIARCLKDLQGRNIEQILCYGLGSFNNGIDIASRYQLALLILMHEYLKTQCSSLSPVIEVFDPSFDQVDKDVLATFIEPKFKLIDENEYCARKLITSSESGCILVYMPHLDKYLYNNLLGANWDNKGLEKLIVFGNSFSEMIDNETAQKCNSELHYLNQLVCNFSGPNGAKRRNLPELESKVATKAMVEIPIDDASFKHSDIFNSLSFHFLDSNWLSENKGTIQKHHQSGWTCVTAEPIDEWN